MTKACRAPNSRRVPNVRTMTLGSPTVMARSRSRSNTIESRRGARARSPPVTAVRARRAAGCSPETGNIDTPVSGRRRVTICRSRSVHACSTQPCSSPSARARTAPPARSTSWKRDHTASATWSVRDSRYQEPPPGSVTRPTLDSSASRIWVLRASRRPSRSGRPSTVS